MKKSLSKLAKIKHLIAFLLGTRIRK